LDKVPFDGVVDEDDNDRFGITLVDVDGDDGKGSDLAN
jgi:hypothetical protein